MNISRFVKHIETSYSFVVKYNHSYDKYIIEDINTVLKEKLSGMFKDSGWIVVDMFTTRKECVDYIEKVR